MREAQFSSLVSRLETKVVMIHMSASYSTDDTTDNCTLRDDCSVLLRTRNTRYTDMMKIVLHFCNVSISVQNFCFSSRVSDSVDLHKRV